MPGLAFAVARPGDAGAPVRARTNGTGDGFAGTMTESDAGDDGSLAGCEDSAP